MIHLRATSLRSRVARRIFGVFLVCAFLPFAALVIFSYYQVSEFFNSKTEHQLRTMAKTLGVNTFQRLLLSKSSLMIIASTVRAAGRFPTEETMDDLVDHPKERWKALAVMTADGKRHRVFGAVDNLPQLTASQKQQISAGQALILVRPATAPNPAHVFMSVSDDPRRPDYHVWIGELQEDYLWGGIQLSRMLPSYLKPCMIHRSGITVMCTYASSQDFVDALDAHINRHDVGYFEWQQEKTKYQAAYWTIPIKAEFASDPWTIVLRTSREGIFASITELTRTFVLAILVSIGLSLLLATYYFRKHLIPVEQLRDGTRKIAKKDFDAPVKITSGDEFEELGVALNWMAGQLRQQFSTIETTADIDRVVLSLLDTPEVIETILTRLMASLSCDCATLRLFNANRTRPERFFVIDNTTHKGTPAVDDGRVKDNGSSAVQSSLLQPLGSTPPGEDEECANGDPIVRLVVESKNLFVTSDLDSYAEMRTWDFVRRRKLRLCVATPLFVKGEVLGVMSFYAKKREPFSADEISLIKGVTNQAAIGIYNSQLFAQTKQQADELEKANKVKDEFLGIISHELRTPLNLIRGYSKMMQEKILGDINPDQEKAVETILKQSNELLEAIENIMEATKLEAGAVITKRNSVNLCALVEELKPQFMRPADKHLAINWQCSSSLPLLMTDEAKLKRILQNLIDNAIKFTDEGQVTIAAAHREGEHVAELKVADTGIGIPQDMIPLLFGLFRQKDSSSTREYAGLGLGLYVAKKLSDLIGAQINVESKVGVGSTFTVTLPVGAKDNQALAV